MTTAEGVGGLLASCGRVRFGPEGAAGKTAVTRRPHCRRALLAFVTAFATLLPGALPAARAQGAAAASATERRPRRADPEAAAQRPARMRADAGEEVGEGDVVRVDTQLVSVPVAVTDRAGRPLTGLRADDFLLFEDGRPQQIANFATAEAPFEVALLLDTSGSTRTHLGLIRRAAHAFVESLRAGDRVALLAFNNSGGGRGARATVEVKAPLTGDREELREAVEAVGASNGTPFYDGLERVARDVFGAGPRRESRARRALVALTDGVDSASESDFDAAHELLKRAGIVTYFIQVNTEEIVEEHLLRDCGDEGSVRLSAAQLRRYRGLVMPRSSAADFSNFCRMGPFERMHINRTLYDLARREMETLARESGGKSFPIADLGGARGAFRQVADELRTQYSLSYYSTNKARDGSFRAIRVRVRGFADAQVRARAGYRAPQG